jgi:hypothetical protein
MSKSITPEYLFESILDSNGIDQEQEDDGETINISRDHLLMIAFSGMNAMLNILVNKGVCTQEEMMGYVAGSVKAITESFDFNLQDK